jgi:hypothetical protein
MLARKLTVIIKSPKTSFAHIKFLSESKSFFYDCVVGVFFFFECQHSNATVKKRLMNFLRSIMPKYFFNLILKNIQFLSGISFV